MPLHIGRVDAQMDITPPAPEATPAQRAPGPAPGLDVERLRSIVVQILQEELAAFRRQQG